VIGLVGGADGGVTAQYEYGPFGELVRSSGSEAEPNPIRFSTKHAAGETGFLYYGYRYEKDGRWISRDPVIEPGFGKLTGYFKPLLSPRSPFEDEAVESVPFYRANSEQLNPTAFVANEPFSRADLLGLYAFWQNTISPGKFEIVIVYGHAAKGKNWKWKMPSSCSAGAAIVCWPGQQVAGLEGNLWEEAENLSTDMIFWVPKGAVSKQNSEDGVPRDSQNRIVATAVLDEVLGRAANRIGEFCGGQCCCPKVYLRLIRLDQGGIAFPDPPATGDVNAVPNKPSSVFDCKTHALSNYVAPGTK
jgi:RHS repeat-associated protein